MKPWLIVTIGAALELAALELFVLAGMPPDTAAGKFAAIILYLVVVAGICWLLRHLALWRALLLLACVVALFIAGMQLLGYFVHRGLVHDVEFGTTNHALGLVISLGLIWAGQAVVMLIVKAPDPVATDSRQGVKLLYGVKMIVAFLIGLVCATGLAFAGWFGRPAMAAVVLLAFVLSYLLGWWVSRGAGPGGVWRWCFCAATFPLVLVANGRFEDSFDPEISMWELSIAAVLFAGVFAGIRLHRKRAHA